MTVPLVDRPASVEFRVSLYGRIHDAITSIAYLMIVVPICAGGAFFQEGKSYWYVLSFGFFFFASLGMGAYSLSQLLRRSPRFILDEHGFMYHGFVRRFRSDWSNITSYRLGGSHGFLFLRVWFTQSPSRFCNNLRFDVARLTPDHKELIEIFRKYVPQGDRTLFP
ncbi:MAG: hypothetical protein NTW42_05385 [Deltaproteobacteria bacterium]|nr:hypothetical protein [Deltaproteobacteria bacterium]